MTNYPEIGIQIPNVLLPKPGIELQKWAVIACDQFTSQPEYWSEVEKYIGDAPSTLKMILPEVYLGNSEEQGRILHIHKTMNEYLAQDIFQVHEGLVLVERTVNGKTRHGMMLSLDLEQYNYKKYSQSLIRATEGTILDRLPPRMKIRKNAPLEPPHILVLIDDPLRTVIEPLFENRDHMQCLYDFDLMFESGHLKGHLLRNSELEFKMIESLKKLANQDFFRLKYGVTKDKGVLLFAVGDGNHSLATAKVCWEEIKEKVGMKHPSRYALVEIENLHDEGLEFEPIHRVLSGIKENVSSALTRHFGPNFYSHLCQNTAEMTEIVLRQQLPNVQTIGIISENTVYVIYITQPSSNLPVGTLQNFLDEWYETDGYKQIDYVHGEDVTIQLGKQPDHLGFFLPPMKKNDLFRTVILDGVLPRKTFSMGKAEEKRFYMECKRIA